MKLITSLLIAALGTTAAGAALTQTTAQNEELTRGRYLAVLGGCNDCHTQGYAAAEGKVAESRWLTGGVVGFFGPWGTSYATNLRLSVQPLSADQWVQYARNLRSLPPMPWFKLREFTEPDLRALHTFIQSLGDAGAPAPAALKPGVQPPPPFVLYPGAAAARP